MSEEVEEEEGRKLSSENEGILILWCFLHPENYKQEDDVMANPHEGTALTSFHKK